MSYLSRGRSFIRGWMFVEVIFWVVSAGVSPVESTQYFVIVSA